MRFQRLIYTTKLQYTQSTLYTIKLSTGEVLVFD